MENNEIKLRPKGLSMSTKGGALMSLSLKPINLFIEPEKTVSPAIKTIKVNSKKDKPKSVEVF